MNCPHCATSNLDTASICVNCGRPLAAGTAPPPPLQSYNPPPPPPPSASTYIPPSPPAGNQGGPAAGAPIPNYLVQSILLLLCCCQPFAVVAIIFAAQVNSKLAAGDYAGAAVASRNAKLWCWIALALGIAGIILASLFGGAGLLQMVRDGMANR